MSNKLNIEIKQGTTFKRTIQAKDTLGALINFTGSQLRGSIKADITDTAALSAFTCTLIDTNTWQISLSATTTDTFNFDIGVYDVEIVWANSDVDRLLEGNVVLSRGVTI